MKAIQVKKDELIAKLRENRANHSAQFEKAAEGYREKVIDVLTQRINEARGGKLPVLVFSLPMPVDQTSAYDRVIGMLEMTVEDIIELEEHDFQQYVRDEWSWSAAASASNTLYLRK